MNGHAVRLSDFVGFPLGRLLTKDSLVIGRSGEDHVRHLAPFAGVVATQCGLAVDCDDLRSDTAKVVHPVEEACLEQVS